MKSIMERMVGVWMKKQEVLLFEGFSGMGNGRTDYEAFHGVAPRMLNWGSHCHDFYEFYIHFHGGHQMSYENQFYALAPCQLFVFPPFSIHGLVCLEETLNYERAFLYCSAETLKRAGCGQMDLDFAFRAALSDKGNGFPMRLEDAQVCRECLRNIHANEQKRTPEAEFENYSLILTFLNRALKAVREKDAKLAQQMQPGPMMQVISYINDHYREPLQLREIAEKFNLSQSALSHDFVRYTNRSVYSYILFRRISMARQLILAGEALGEVSEICGFADYSNFLRNFRKYTGMSPREYRNYPSSDAEKAQAGGKAPSRRKEETASKGNPPAEAEE